MVFIKQQSKFSNETGMNIWDNSTLRMLYSYYFVHIFLFGRVSKNSSALFSDSERIQLNTIVEIVEANLFEVHRFKNECILSQVLCTLIYLLLSKLARAFSHCRMLCIAHFVHLIYMCWSIYAILKSPAFSKVVNFNLSTHIVALHLLLLFLLFAYLFCVYFW